MFQTSVNGSFLIYALELYHTQYIGDIAGELHNNKSKMRSLKNLLVVLVLLNIVLHSQSAPSSRRSRAKTITDDETTTAASANDDKIPKEENSSPEPPTPSKRKNKALNLFGYYPSFLSSSLDYNEDDDEITFGISDEGIDEEELSRTIPSKRRQNMNKKKNGNGYENDNINSLQYDNSPMFFIRLPPTPYMFVPGLGYISQPPSLGPPMAPPLPQPVPPQDPFINLPIDFISNGKPIGVYQWNGSPGYPQVPQVPQMAVDPYGYGPSPPVMPPAPRPTYTPSYLPPKPKPAATNSKITNLKGPYVFNGKPNDSVYVLRDTYNSIYSDALQNFYP